MALNRQRICYTCGMPYESGLPHKCAFTNIDKVEKPQHYHKHGMDTFTFLEHGFRSEVARGFYIGNIIKYIQRYELKNGIEDLMKAEKYLKTLIEFVGKDEQ